MDHKGKLLHSPVGVGVGVPGGVALAIAVAVALSSGPAHAQRRPPFGPDAALLEARTREDIERKIGPTLEQMAPGQAELKYIDVRVNRPTALPTGASPGFEELGPEAAFVVESVEVALLIDAKLPPPFRKDLKNLIKGRLESLPVKIEIKETVQPFPTPRPQPMAREIPPAYAPPPPAPPAPAPQPAPTPPPAAAPDATPRAAPPMPGWLVALLVALGIGVLLALVGVALLLLDRRGSRKRGDDAASSEADKRGAGDRKAATADADRRAEVRRALREDPALARRVMAELLERGEHDRVARAVELVGPQVVADLRSDPRYASGLAAAAVELEQGRPLGEDEAQRLAQDLFRRILKQQMMGAEDPVEREFAFLGGVPPERLAATLAGESRAVQAAVLRYTPPHTRAAYVDRRPPDERVSLLAALAEPSALSREHLLDVAATLRARAAELGHVGAGGDAAGLEVLAELVEARPPAERAALLEAMRRADPRRTDGLAGVLLDDEALGRMGPEVLAAGALQIPVPVLATYLRGASPGAVEHMLAALPPSAAAAAREELSLSMHVSAEQAADTRRLVHAAVRRALRERGLTVTTATAAAVGPADDAGKKDPGRKVVAI